MDVILGKISKVEGSNSSILERLTVLLISVTSVG